MPVIHQGGIPNTIKAIVVLGEAKNEATGAHVQVILADGTLPMVLDVATQRVFELPWTDIVDMAQAAFDDPANAVPKPVVQ